MIAATTRGTPLSDLEARALWWLADQDPDVVASIVAVLTRAGAATSPRTAARPPGRRRPRTAGGRVYSASERGEPRVQRWEAYADDYAMLARAGYPLDVVAARLGLTFDALDKALERHRDDPRARRPIDV